VAIGEDYYIRQLISRAAEISREAPHNLLHAAVRSEARVQSKMRYA